MKLNNNFPRIIEGGIFTDERGTVRFANGFELLHVKRFYVIEHKKTSTIRAWQGHRVEMKYFFPIKGSFVIAWVRIDDFDNPDKNLKAEFTILDADKNLKVLYVPPGYANGFRALRRDSILGCFSNLSLKESNKDIVRFPADWWFDWDKYFSES